MFSLSNELSRIKSETYANEFTATAHCANKQATKHAMRAVTSKCTDFNKSASVIKEYASVIFPENFSSLTKNSTSSDEVLKKLVIFMHGNTAKNINDIFAIQEFLNSGFVVQGKRTKAESMKVNILLNNVPVLQKCSQAFVKSLPENKKAELLKSYEEIKGQYTKYTNEKNSKFEAKKIAIQKKMHQTPRTRKPKAVQAPQSMLGWVGSMFTGL